MTKLLAIQSDFKKAYNLDPLISLLIKHHNGSVMELVDKLQSIEKDLTGAKKKTISQIINAIMECKEVTLQIEFDLD